MGNGFERPFGVVFWWDRAERCRGGGAFTNLLKIIGKCLINSKNILEIFAKICIIEY